MAAPLQEEDDDAQGGFTAKEILARILPYYSRYRFELLQSVVLLLVTIGLGLTGPIVLGQLVDLATHPGGDGGGRPLLLPVPWDRTGLLMLAGVFVGVVAVGFLFEAALGFVMSRVGISMVIQLKEDLFRKIFSLDPEFFREYPPGRLIARVESDTEALKDLFTSTGIQLLRAVLTFVGIFAAMALFDPETTLTVTPLLIGITLATLFFVRYVRKYFHRSRKHLATITSHITEYVQGIEVVQHYDYLDNAEERLRDAQLKRYRADVTADFLNYGFWGLIAFGEIGAVALILSVGVGKVAAGTLTLGTLIVFVEYLRQVFLPILLLSEFVTQVQRGFVSAARAFKILALEPTVTSPPDAPAPSFEEGVRYEDVRFSYDGKAEALRGVSFEIPRGKKIALVGPSGGGKSTIVKLLLRYHDPTSGRISVDGADLREVSRADWRRTIGLVPQDVFLFPGTLGENMTVFNDGLPAEQITDAATAVHADRLIRSRPGGLDAELAERGANLSHGERQLVSLARAVIHTPELLVLDEATSSIDPVTEQLIQDSLERMLAKRTALIVAHRLSTIRQCDQILVVEQGRIVERGTHDELWAASGVYRSMAELQLASLDGGAA